MSARIGEIPAKMTLGKCFEPRGDCFPSSTFKVGSCKMLAKWNRVAYTYRKGQEKVTNFGWNLNPFPADKIRGIEPLACYSDGGANYTS